MVMSQGASKTAGAELIKLVAAHPRLELAFVSSRERAGQRLSDHHPEFQGDLQYENLDADAVAAKGVDAVILDDAFESIRAAVLINITGGSDLTLFETSEAATYIQQCAMGIGNGKNTCLALVCNHNPEFGHNAS